ncbi:hypothetical protein HYH02_009782 [Chlamydomonas schloesseri]|uniref:N-acetyltransferase domain-containing protein n=1 Tax=Chlamydomonas schloesseri TaxID=2026947 RepID=A0A835W8V3_9CHLO|nr:hypothetical protein HYH02_009782 [Chlamydomonas schloesseri]|eukprot:KAG2441989.1 hypothetical protein HYH02_009782 [Chlamydomonas schloesseri]
MLASSRAGGTKPGRCGNRHLRTPGARPSHAPARSGVCLHAVVPPGADSPDGCRHNANNTWPGTPPQPPPSALKPAPPTTESPESGPSAPAAAPPAAPRLRLRLARTEQDFAAVANIWAEALLLPGLTELQSPHPGDAAELQRLTAQTAERLRAAHERKLRAAAATRALRARGQALLAALRRGGGGGEGSLSGMELLMKRRQLEAIRRELRRARRRRMWACLLAYAGEPLQGADQQQQRRLAAQEGVEEEEVEVEMEEEEEEEEGQEAAGCSAEGRSAMALTCRVEGQHGGGVHPPDSRHNHHHHNHPHPRPHHPHEPHHSRRRHSPQPHTPPDQHPPRRPATPSSATAPRPSSPHHHPPPAPPPPPPHNGTCTSRPPPQHQPQQPRPAGYVLVSLSQPLALLPPPLPSRAPLCPHVDALAVAPGWRRRGAGAALLAAAEQLARRWGSSSLWLHVDAANDRAVQLYTDAGYRVARVLQPQSRLAAALAALPAALLAAAAAGAGAGARGQSRGSGLGGSAGQAQAQDMPLAGQRAVPPPQHQQEQQQQQQQSPKLRGRQFVMQKQLRRAHVAAVRRPLGSSGAAAQATGRPAIPVEGGGHPAAGSADSNTGDGGGPGAEAPDLARPQRLVDTATGGGASAAGAVVGAAAAGSTPRPEPQLAPAERGSAGKPYKWRA